jgi:hypothetical protein
MDKTAVRGIPCQIGIPSVSYESIADPDPTT